PISEAELPGHLAAEAGAMEGDNAGEVLPGQKPIDAALRELKAMAGIAPPPAPVAAKPAPAKSAPAATPARPGAKPAPATPQ
ncbi:MAG: peptidase S41, partial [Thermomonas sp.]